MKKFLLSCIAAVVMAWAIVPRSGAAPKEMNDEQMDKVSGGLTASVDLGQNGVATLTDYSVYSIHVGEQAQQNLSSLVNILSINSTIQVMLNLNVSINSSVGTINQGNTGTQSGQP